MKKTGNKTSESANINFEKVRVNIKVFLEDCDHIYKNSKIKANFYAILC